ncbi:MAG: flagellar biosynthetic protein FliR [Treponema sp.]|nr:flagellar biosynthetic protein FliR [Treponema sp.]
MLDLLVTNAPIFLLAAVRCFALLMTLPLLSMRSVSRVAKVALAGYMAYIVLPHVNYTAYSAYLLASGNFSIEYLLCLIGEALIGIIMGFYISVIFSAFSTAGQFFAFQMGFSASEVYDALSQVENPLMGQYLNLIAMLIFLQSKWFQLLFMKGLVSSFESVDIFGVLSGSQRLAQFMMSGLTDLFADALIISLPLMGTLCLISVCMGILSKAAPQMNLLSEGFPLMTSLSFILLTALMPDLCDFFISAFETGFGKLSLLLSQLSGGGL